MQRVEVTWIDASMNTGWSTKEEALKVQPPVCYSVGWLLKRTRKMVLLVLSRGEGENSHVADVLTIPAGMVKKVRTLR